MKVFQRLVSKLLYLLLCTMVISCSDKSDPFAPEPNPKPEPTPVEKEYELADNVIELEGDLLENVSSVKGDTLVYDSGIPANELPKVGDIVLVTQSTDVFPYGFLGKVAKISNDGNVNVITEAAALDEAFVYLDVEGTYELEPADSQERSRASIENTESYNISHKISVEISRYISGTVELGINAKLGFKFYIDKRNGKNIRSGYVDVDLENYIGLGASLAYGEKDEDNGKDEAKQLGNGLKLGKIVVGAILIEPVLQPYIKPNLEGSAKFMWSGETRNVRRIRMNFDGDKWSMSPMETDKAEFDFDASPDIEMNGSAFLGPGLALEFRLYGNKNLKVALNAQAGIEASGEMSLATNKEKVYETLQDAKLSLALKGGVGLEASAKVFFIKLKWEHMFEKVWSQWDWYAFPSFENNSLAYEQGDMFASTTLGRNLLWKQNVGLALYKGDERIEVSEPVEYKFEKDFKERNPLEGIFEDIPEEEKGDYSIWSYVKWGDFYIKCKQLTPKKKIKSMSMTEVSTSSLTDKYSFYYTNDSIDRIVHKESYYDDDITYKFNYLNDSTIKVIGTISDEQVVCNLKLNDDGYIKKCLYSYSGPEGSYSQTFEFEYDDDGRMTYMKRSEGNEVWRLVYNNSNAISVSCNGNKTNSISYGNLECPENWIWYGWMMGLDIDEMDIFGLIGMLGKSSKNLPTVNKGLGEEYSLHYDWSMDGYGYPDRVVIDEDGSDYVLNLSWE